MGNYPIRAERQIQIDGNSDLRDLMEKDAAGQLGYGSTTRDVYPGEIWLDVIRNEPPLFPKLVPVVCDFVGDTDARRRELALIIMEHFADAAFLRALREAFERDASMFIGVDSPSGLGETLFAKWLAALDTSAFKDPAEYARAAALAKPHLGLREAGNFDSLVPLRLEEPYVQWLPQLVAKANDQKLTGLVIAFSPQQLPTVADALAQSSENNKRRFASIAKKQLQARFPKDAARVSAEIERRLGVHVP